MARSAIALALLVVILLCAGWTAGPRERTVQVAYPVFPGLCMMDGSWAALFTAHAGKV